MTGRSFSLLSLSLLSLSLVSSQLYPFNGQMLQLSPCVVGDLYQNWTYGDLSLRGHKIWLSYWDRPWKMCLDCSGSVDFSLYYCRFLFLLFSHFRNFFRYMSEIRSILKQSAIIYLLSLPPSLSQVAPPAPRPTHGSVSRMALATTTKSTSSLQRERYSPSIRTRTGIRACKRCERERE